MDARAQRAILASRELVVGSSRFQTHLLFSAMLKRCRFVINAAFALLVAFAMVTISLGSANLTRSHHPAFSAHSSWNAHLLSLSRSIEVDATERPKARSAKKRTVAELQLAEGEGDAEEDKRKLSLDAALSPRLDLSSLETTSSVTDIAQGSSTARIVKRLLSSGHPRGPPSA